MERQACTSTKNVPRWCVAPHSCCSNFHFFHLFFGKTTTFWIFLQLIMSFCWNNMKQPLPGVQLDTIILGFRWYSNLLRTFMRDFSLPMLRLKKTGGSTIFVSEHQSTWGLLPCWLVPHASDSLGASWGSFSCSEGFGRAGGGCHFFFLMATPKKCWNSLDSTSIFFWNLNLLLCNFGGLRKRGIQLELEFISLQLFGVAKNRYTAGFHSKFYDSTLEFRCTSTERIALWPWYGP